MKRKNQDTKIKYLLIGIVLLFLVAFFWPKTNSIWDDDITANLADKSYYKNMACVCIGLTSLRNDCKSCTQYADCYGIAISCSFTCRQKVNGIWQDVSCINSSMDSYPADNESCIAQGGQWGPIGLSPEEVCVMPTTDAGKVCYDSSNCQSACVADLSPLEYNILIKYHIPIPKFGRCTAWKSSVGCNAYVNNGIVNGILCID